MWSITRTVAALAATLVLAGCQHRMETMQNVSNTPIPRELHKLPLETLENQIITGGTKNAWVITRAEPGRLTATSTFRQHSATVNILVTQGAYSIVHVATTNLKEEDGQVHRAYNNQIRLLQRNVDGHLARFAATNPSGQ